MTLATNNDNVASVAIFQSFKLVVNMKKEQIKVQYLSHMGSDKTVVNAARASFNKESSGDITLQDKSLMRFLARGYTSEEWDTLSRQLAVSTDYDEIKIMMWGLRTKASHFAPFCHPQISLRMTTSLDVARQLWKSHIGCSGGDNGYAAWSEESRRYVSDEPDMFMPEKLRLRPSESIKQGSGTDAELYKQPDYKNAIERAYEAGLTEYAYLLDEGVAPEQARLVLPVGSMTTWVWTGSLQFFSRIYMLRRDSHAQKESQDVAYLINDIIEPLFPVSWSALTNGK